jgi:hypothetical protein
VPGKAVIRRSSAGGWILGPCGEGEFVRAGDGVDRVVEAVAERLATTRSAQTAIALIRSDVEERRVL